MNVLRVAQKVYPDVKGGAPYHVHAMSRDQAARGHDVTVLTVRYDPELPRREERDGYTVVRRDPTVTLLGNDVSPGVATYLWDVDGVDVIHAHSHLYFSTNLAALARRFGDVPLAITNHGLFSQSAPEWVFRWYLRTIGRYTFNRADLVFCYTREDAERLREFGVDTSVAVVPNGIDTERFQPAGPASNLVDSDGPVVLFVGRLIDGKRPFDALEAVERLREAHPDVTLYFVGAGPLRERLEERAGDQLGDGVVFLGHVPYDEMPRLYRSADAFVLPSRSEGVPRVVLEAMACGLPVVASDLPYVSSVVDAESSAFVEVGDVDGFSESIGDVLDSESIREAARRNARERRSFRWERTVERTTAAYAKHLPVDRDVRPTPAATPRVEVDHE